MASGFNINTFKTDGLQYGGARPSLFEIILTIPDGVAADSGSASKLRFTARAASLPAAQIGIVEVGYFGRRIKLAGDRVFPDWTISVMNDEDFLVRSMFEKWSNSLNRLESNLRDSAYGSGENSYKADIEIVQYTKDGAVARSYIMVGAFPTNVDAIELGWDAQNQIETFNVTFSYDYWLPNIEDSNQYLSDATSTTTG